MARRALGPATLALVQAVSATLDEAPAGSPSSGSASKDSSTWRDPSSIMVACSGGPDSLALAAAASLVADRRSLRCSAVIVDHGLQDESATVAQTAADQLATLGYDDVEVVRVVVATSGSGPEADAREARYRVLDDHAARRSALVLLGHTLDDQAETVLLGLARGSGTRSLAGMAASAGHYRRPLLGLRRSDTERACAELGLTPWHDPHNGSDNYTRSRLRRRVLPLLEAELGPGIAEALARTALLARDDADLLDHLAAEQRARFPIDGLASTGNKNLDCSVLAEQPAAIRRRIIKTWLADAGVAPLTLAHVLAVEALVTDWRGQRGIDVPKATVVRDAGQLRCVAG